MIIKSDKSISAHSAVEFFRKNKEKLGKIVKVEVKRFFYPETQELEDYPLCLVDEKDNEMFIAGVASGFEGGSSNGLRIILEEGCRELLGSNGIDKKGLRALVVSSFEFTIS